MKYIVYCLTLGIIQVAIAQGQGALGGRVWHDANRNNVQDPKEEGISGVTVSLLANGTSIQTITTNAKGAYLFEGLKDGTYQVLIAASEPILDFVNCKGAGDPNVFNQLDDNGEPGGGALGGARGTTITRPIEVSARTLQRGKYVYDEVNYFSSENGVDWVEGGPDKKFDFTCYDTDEDFIYIKAHVLIKLPRAGGQLFFKYNEGDAWAPLYWVNKVSAGDVVSRPKGNNSVDFGFYPKQSKTVVTGDYPLTSFDVSVEGTPITVAMLLNSWQGRAISAYGQLPVLDVLVASNEAIDVLWVEQDGNKHLDRLSLETGEVLRSIPIPDRVGTGRFLGIEQMGEDRYAIGYGRNNAAGDDDNEAWITGFTSSGKEIFSTRLFGEIDRKKVWSKGDPGAASTSTLTYHPEADVLMVYMGHDMRWDDNVRHQGGWVGFLNGQTGELLMNGEQVIGDQWFYSHNFDQRALLSANGQFYTLSHGDAYPRALGLYSWSHANGKGAGLEYYDIRNGREGDNETHAHTGDFVELQNSDVAIVYTTSDGRRQRDLRLTLVSGMGDGQPRIKKDIWLTENSEEFVGWGAKVTETDNGLLIGWNRFRGENQAVGSAFIRTDLSGRVLGKPQFMDEIILYPSQPFNKTPDGRVVFASATATGLRVHVMK